MPPKTCTHFYVDVDFIHQAGRIMSGHNVDIIGHYSDGHLFDRLGAGLCAMGKLLDDLSPQDLKPVDEFHIGGVLATDALLAQLEINADSRVLDLGCGLGGTARHIAVRSGAQVDGVDITPEYIQTAQKLDRLVGLNNRYQVGSVLHLPYADNSFDFALLIHVGMNVADKPALFAQAARVLRPGGTLAVYDVMLIGDRGPTYPVPWSSKAEASFLATPDAYLAAAKTAGFTLKSRRDRGDFAKEFFAQQAARLQKDGPPVFGLGLVFGADAVQKMQNLARAVMADLIAPTEMIFARD